MIINGKDIAKIIIDDLKNTVAELPLKPHLADFLVKGKQEDYAYVRTKERYVKRVGGDFTFHDYKSVPEFMIFANKLKQVGLDDKITGIIIQQPLPSNLSTDTLYNYIPLKKEIEGHKNKSDFCPPVGLAILTILKYIFLPGDKTDANLLKVDFNKDLLFFKRVLKKKKIVLVGKGNTGGKPIGHVLNLAKINFINIHSKTPNPESFYKEADIIITAVGKKIIKPEYIKEGVILLNIGLRRENDEWKGDYEEDEIKNIAGFYTPIVGGVGPLDITYLVDNLVKATKMQI
jgi:methylenetetrahydrofolate dehydrogenase (NADP+)/methenyltetrahydrofolate cyclohydrolase